MRKFQEGQKALTSKIELIIQDDCVCLDIQARNNFQISWECLAYMTC